MKEGPAFWGKKRNHRANQPLLDETWRMPRALDGKRKELDQGGVAEPWKKGREAAGGKRDDLRGAKAERPSRILGKSCEKT